MKIFLDSSLLIEYEKQTNTSLLEALVESDHQIFINPIVASEYLYQLIGIIGGCPNDAIILATCKMQDVHVLASHDSDFANACSEEGIRLIKELSDLR